MYYEVPKTCIHLLYRNGPAYLTPVDLSLGVSGTDLLVPDLDVRLILLIVLVVHLLTIQVVQDWQLGKVQLVRQLAAILA